MITQYRRSLYNNYFVNHASVVTSMEESLNHRKYYNDFFLHRFLPRDKNVRILDIGCGYGSLLASLKNLGYLNFTGVDSSQEAISLLQTTDFAQNVIEAEIIEFLEESVTLQNTWDVVLAIDVLEHFNKNEVVHILCLLRKAITSTGTLIIKIPNMQSPLLAGTTAFGDFTHEAYVTPRSLTQVLNACGFNNVEVYEAAPVPYTFISSIRYQLWKIVSCFYTFIYALETGSYDKSMIWSRSFFAVARSR